MSTLVHSIETTTADGIEVRTVVREVYPHCYSVRCNGNEVGHECSGRADVLIEDGDTWASDLGAVEAAEQHASEHRDRGAQQAVEPTPWSISVADIALMRQLIAWRKSAGVELRPERGAWVDMTKPFRGGQRTITWADRDQWPNGDGEVGFASDYVTEQITWVRVSSLTEAVDILAAKGYVPVRFSSAYKAGWEAGEEDAEHGSDHGKFMAVAPAHTIARICAGRR